MEPEGSLPHSQVPATCPILSQFDPVHTLTSQFLKILILSSNLRLGLPSGLFPSGFPTETLYTPLLSPIRATCPAYLILLGFYHPNNIGWGVQIFQLLSMQLPPLPSCCVCYQSLFVSANTTLRTLYVYILFSSTTCFGSFWASSGALYNIHFFNLFHVWCKMYMTMAKTDGTYSRWHLNV